MTPQSSATFASPPAPIEPDIASHWSLDRKIAFLNHGSFGACPIAVLEVQSRWREELEREPVQFFERSAPRHLDKALEAIAAFLNASPSELGFVTNATEGVASVVRSLHLKRGDEIVTTNHAYDAVSHTFSHVAGQFGAKVIRVRVPIPFLDADAFVADIAQALSPRTRLLVVDHITSVSALILPVERIIADCQQRGIDILVDGAHAPGTLDLDLDRLGATYYTGNFHKWVCAPKGAAFLWAQKDRHKDLHPAIISNHYGRGFHDEFAWQGTRDITPWLSVPSAIEFMTKLGWRRVRDYQKELVRWAHRLLVDAWQVEPIAPLDGSHHGSMFTLPLPKAKRTFTDRFVCSAALYREHNIEAPIVEVEGRRMIRPSCQVYNHAEQYQRLASAIATLLDID